MKAICVTCGKQNLDKDTIGLNKKFLGATTKRFFCMSCLAEYLGTTVSDLQEKLEEFREAGCTLFS